MIGDLLDNIAAALDAQRGAGELLEGIAAVRVGDEQPNETAEHPLVTIDLARDATSLDGYQPGSALRVQLELTACLYVCKIEKGNTPARTALDLYWRVAGGAQKGLKVALRAVGAVEAGPAKFVLSLGDARPKRKAQSPQGRWTYGLEVPLTARAAVGRL